MTRFYMIGTSVMKESNGVSYDDYRNLCSIMCHFCFKFFRIQQELEESRPSPTYFSFHTILQLVRIYSLID